MSELLESKAMCSLGRAVEENKMLRAEIARLRESLAIFVHAHATGNSVPPHIEAKAFALVKEVRAKNPTCPPADRL